LLSLGSYMRRTPVKSTPFSFDRINPRRSVSGMSMLARLRRASDPPPITAIHPSDLREIAQSIPRRQSIDRARCTFRVGDGTGARGAGNSMCTL
jgi:hypothetical protein